MQRAPRDPVIELTAVARRLSPRVETARWFDVDVTKFVRAQRQAGQTVVSFALRNVTVTPPYVEFASRDHAVIRVAALQHRKV
jgi:hypothetical protein